jgi:hypothetical protein
MSLNIFKHFLMLCCLFACTSVMAKDLNVVVKLMQIDAKKYSEKAGDELYFSMTEYSSNSVPTITRVPGLPKHWISKELPDVKNVTLWEGKLQDNESVLLILTLLEQDVPPWDADDHIGSTQVKILNKNGMLQTQWGLPQFRDQPKVQQPDPSVPKFMMFGANSEYVTLFRVELKK